MATQKQKEKALERAAKAQIRYWDALRTLETVLGLDLDDSPGELRAYTVQELEDEYGDADIEDQQRGMDEAAAGNDPIERMYREAFEGETENDRAK